jgi:hypothetical protein
MRRRIIYAITCSAFIAVTVVIGARYSAGVEAQNFSILFVGDILLANEAERQIHNKGVDYPFWKIKEELLKYDFIVANLESPITERGIPVTKKPYIFRIKPEDAVCLKDLKIDAVSIANNHLMDYSVPGMEDTITTLDGLNIRHTGGGKDLSEARRPALLKYRDTNIVILSYCNRPPADYYASDSGPGIAPLDTQMIKDDIQAFKLKDNIVVISLHWGIEQTHVPQKDQVDTAHSIIDAGADAVIGHHPHWPQGIEIYKNRPIVYSLGNFINGYINPIERDNIAVGLYYSGSTLERIRVVPLAGRNRQIKFQPYILTGWQANGFLGLIRGLSQKFKTVITIKNGYGYIDPVSKPALAGVNEVKPPRRIRAVQPSPTGGTELKTGNR